MSLLKSILPKALYPKNEPDLPIEPVIESAQIPLLTIQNPQKRQCYDTTIDTSDDEKEDYLERYPRPKVHKSTRDTLDVPREGTKMILAVLECNLDIVVCIAECFDYQDCW
ncbi:hypothetical protein BDW69DRAFT_167468 [Aspergillus filifer]